MHKKYANEGFVAVSLSLDDGGDEQTRKRVDGFLQKNQATMINRISLGNPDDWYEKLNTGGLPLVYVFDRENRRVKKLVGEEVNYKNIEAEVVHLLKK